MKRTQKRPWYRKPAWLISIAAVLVALGVVLFFLLPLLVFVILKNTVEKSVAAAPLPCITARLDADF